jgi:hypothetical protein
MIAPRIPLVRDGQILSTNLVNSMIGRIEYAADLLRQYGLIAGDEMYVEPHFDGTRVSYLQPVKGGATPLQGLFTGFPSETDPKYNAAVLIEKYKPGNEPSTPTQAYWQPFIDGVTIDVANLIEIYGGNVFLKGTMTGINGLMTGFFQGPTILVQFGPSPGPFGYVRLSTIPASGLTFKLTSYYFGDPPFVPPREFYPAGVSFEIVDSVT